MLRRELVRVLHWCKGKETLEESVLNASWLIESEKFLIRINISHEVH